MAEIAKKIFFVILSVVFVGLSRNIVLVVLTGALGSRSTISTLVNSLLINAFITGIFAYPGFVFPTHKLISPKYFVVRSPKLLARIYRLLGIGLFRKALLLFFWGHKKNRVKYFDGTRGGLDNFVYQSKQAEFGHLGAFLTISSVCILLLFNELYRYALATTAINIVGNVYPIILQRYHRIRIERVLNSRSGAENNRVQSAH